MYDWNVKKNYLPILRTYTHTYMRTTDDEDMKTLNTQHRQEKDDKETKEVNKVIKHKQKDFSESLVTFVSCQNTFLHNKSLFQLNAYM